MRKSSEGLVVSVLAIGVIAQVWSGQAQAAPFYFTAGDIVVSVEGNGVEGAPANTSTYGDNQASPLTLFEYGVNGTASASYAGSVVLPQNAPSTPGSNYNVSGEYGSSSEGTLQLSGNGQYLTIAGYGVNAATFDANQSGFGGTTKTCAPTNTTCFPLGQTASVANYPTSAAAAAAGDTATYATVVPRVIATIGSTGVVNSTTALTGVFNENNPRSVYSATGTSFYISGQGTGNVNDATGGVFYVPSVGANQTAVPITGQDATSKTVSQDTREVQTYNNTLYVSVDSKQGSGNARSFVGTLGSPPATSLYNNSSGPTMLPGFGNSGGTGQVTLTAATTNGVTNAAGQTVNLSPENFVFADNGLVMYVADDGAPKQTSASSPNGDGGLQKWSLSGYTLVNGVPVGGTWSLDYTLAGMLNLVANSTANSNDTSGTTGLYGLTGEQVTINGVAEEELFATNFTIGDLDPTYLYGITDVLSDTSNPGDEVFTQLASAPADSDFKGVAFAPVPEPASLALLVSGLLGVGVLRRRKKA